MLDNDSILSYRQMCEIENVQTLQRGMNYRLNPKYSVILMSQKANAPYKDRIYEDGLTIEYEGHDIPRLSFGFDSKHFDQSEVLPSGKLTQNGYFIKAITEYKSGLRLPEVVRVYEKIKPGIWSLKGQFSLLDYKVIHDGKRNVYRYILHLIENEFEVSSKHTSLELSHTRIIPSEVKIKVWKRDKGICVICGSSDNLHFDHELPFSLGGTSLLAENIRLLCARHNLAKSNKIE